MSAPEVRDLEDPEPNWDAPQYKGDSSTDTAPGTGQYLCEECGTPISTPSGRKPRVMLCDEHKGKNSKGKSPVKGTRHDFIAQQMTALHDMAGFGVGALSLATQNPVWLADKAVIGAASPQIGEAWAKVCDSDPKMRARVLKFLDMAGTVSLAAAYAPLAFAIMRNHQAATQTPQQSAMTPGHGMGV